MIPYPIELRWIESLDNPPGIWEACVPLLGRFACLAVGESPSSAMKALEHSYEFVVNEYKLQNITLPPVPKHPSEDLL